jgi:predicted component of type VI protein secretion system
VAKITDDLDQKKSDVAFNATFNNISVISWQTVLLVEETGRLWVKCCFMIMKRTEIKINIRDNNYVFIKMWTNIFMSI